jgi:hypothetical protein
MPVLFNDAQTTARLNRIWWNKGMTMCVPTDESEKIGEEVVVAYLKVRPKIFLE